MVTYTLKIIEIRKETFDTVTLCFKQPVLRKIRYIAGQYLTLIFRINGRRYIRPYSFSSAPAVDKNLEVTVKRVINGVVSNHIHDRLNIGDNIEAMQPMGDFICTKPVKTIFLWGAGSGITPLISIVKQLLSESNSTVKLVYSNRSSEQTIFLKTIEALKIKYPERFSAWHFYTQLSVSQYHTYLVQGRVTAQSVKGILGDAEYLETQHFICGPLGLKKLVKGALFDLGMSPDQVFTEDFELIRDPRDFESITTQNISLYFSNQLYELEVIKGKSILESALDAGIEIPYSCQTGNCSTCKGRLIKGNAKMIGLDKKRDDLIEGEVLLCCSYPVTDNVYIEI